MTRTQKNTSRTRAKSSLPVNRKYVTAIGYQQGQGRYGREPENPHHDRHPRWVPIQPHRQSHHQETQQVKTERRVKEIHLPVRRIRPEAQFEMQDERDHRRRDYHRRIDQRVNNPENRFDL
jgi:hypothetical protein